ncbi:LysR family transcriptional regulator [Salmonella enterica subsp. enterica serovar Choleraesuis]|nr:LysR family transcriptional regulator [Salmonella enterica subsp. enterica serovar Choleraesuis]
MNYSPEALEALVETVASGSFSGAARRLNKSQSTISAAIANLEVDLDIQLFDRSRRQPQLTEAGRRVLVQAREILEAHYRLEQLAIRLADRLEPRLTFVLSDTFDPLALEQMMRAIDRRFPDIEFECLVNEEEDVIDLLQKQRAHLGLVASRDRYPPDIGAARLPHQTEMALFAAPDHPLASRRAISPDQLAATRELRLGSYLTAEREPEEGSRWSAPNYLLLLSMAVQGLGWSMLPTALVQEFSSAGQLVVLDAIGWPRQVSVDVVWSRQAPPGPAGLWLRDYLLAGAA